MMHELSQLAINRIGMLLIAALTDLVIGDPQQMWHPVQGVGFVIDRAQKMLRGERTPGRTQSLLSAMRRESALPGEFLY